MSEWSGTKRRLAAGFFAALLFLVISRGSCLCESGHAGFKYLFSIEGFSMDEPFMSPVEIFYDSEEGNLYVADSGRGEIGVFQQDGFPVMRLGKNHGLLEPIGMAVDTIGNIYVCDNGYRTIRIFNILGDELPEFDLSQTVADRDVHPDKIKLRAGGFLVLDRKNQNALALDEAGKVESVLSLTIANSVNELKMPADIAQAPGGEIVISDSLGNPVKVYGSDGRLVSWIPKALEGYGQFSLVKGIDIDSEGNYWIVDTFQHKVVVLDREGKFKFQFGDMGLEKGEFFFPVDVALDEKGKRVFVLEKDGRRVQVFSYE